MKYLDLSGSYEAKSAAIADGLNLMLAERLPDSGVIATVQATYDDHAVAAVVDPVTGEMEVWDVAYGLDQDTGIIDIGVPVLIETVGVVSDATASATAAVFLSGDTVLGHALAEKRLRDLHRKAFVAEATSPDGQPVEAKGWVGVAPVIDDGRLDMKGCQCQAAPAGGILDRLTSALDDEPVAGKAIEAIVLASALLAEVKAIDTTGFSGLAEDPGVRQVADAFFAMGDALADMGIIPMSGDDPEPDMDDDDGGMGDMDGFDVLLGGKSAAPLVETKGAPIVESPVDDETAESLAWFLANQGRLP